MRISAKLFLRIDSFGLSTHLVHRWVATFFISTSMVVPMSDAQDDANIPVIRVEAHEVLIPVSVDARIQKDQWDGYAWVEHFKAQDFHLFEDEKEQTIERAMLVRHYRTGTFADNLGYQMREAQTPNGWWTILNIIAGESFLTSPPIYLIAYRPPESAEGSCHSITIEANSKDETGNKMALAESGPFVFRNEIRNLTAMIDRRNLRLHYRKQYCNAPYAASDPLFSTTEGAQLESVLSGNGADEDNFYLKALDHFDESKGSRVYVVLDFSHLSRQTGFPEFQASVLGLFSRKDGSSVFRFSDNTQLGCPAEDASDLDLHHVCGRDFFINHYETDVELSPGDYNLRVAIDFGGTLRRAEVPVHVRAPEKSLAVSGIALCRRYFAHDQPLQGPQPPPDGIPTLPFELTPLVSKGIEFTPTADTRFKKKDPLAAYFEVYEPLLTGKGNVNAQFEIRVINAKTGEVKSDTGFKPADGYVNQGKKVIPISQKVRIEELSPGEYQVQVRAQDSAGNSTDWRSTSFTRE